ncbi:MAG: metallophosphoesterase [Acidobacteriota bacterium]
MSRPLSIAILGDLHGHLDPELDAPLLAAHPVRLCTGDLTPNRGRERFAIAMGLARNLAELDAHTILGNHDGPTCFTGRSFPKSYLRLEKALGEHHLGGRRVELPEHELTLVGARPLSCGGPSIRFPVPEREDWTLERWAESIVENVLAAEHEHVIVLAHDGPTGLGDRRDSIYGCDFKREEEGDWGDADLRMALDEVTRLGRPVTAVVAGHMHHQLIGGGERVPIVREGPTLHVNAAVVPRVSERGRALVVLTLDEAGDTSAELWWHRDDGVDKVALSETVRGAA